jgi:hypothetical protein
MTGPESERRLDEAGRALGRASGADLERLAIAARADLARTPKAQRWWVEALVLLAINLTLGLMARVMMTDAETQHASAMSKYATVVAWFVAMSLGSVWWLKPGGGLLGRVALGAFAVALVAGGLDASGVDPGGPFWGGVGCAMGEWKLALVPAVVVLLLSMRFSVQPGRLFLGALAAASGGAIALHGHCPNGTLAHIAVFHVLPTFSVAAVLLAIRHFIPSRSHAP